jgi:tetratricopeptide (TPR) repeat protein
MQGSIGKNLLLAVLIILGVLSSPVSADEHWQLANDGKSGLYVKSIDEVLRLSDDDIDLATAALIISEGWSDVVPGRRYLATLDEMAQEINERLQRLRLRPSYKAIPVINKYLFEELGFAPISQADDPNDLFLHSVLDKRRGYCLSLSVLYLAIGERLGMPLYGVVVPGHFFVRFQSGQTHLNIETTSKGAFVLDEHYIKKFKVPEGDGDSVYMKNLTKIQTLGCLFNNLGNIYYDMGNLQKALSTLEKAVQINPALSESRASLGNVYMKMGRLDEAIAQYQTALRIHPKDPNTHNNLGNAYLEKDWLNYAVPEYRQSLQLDPNFIAAHKNLAIAYCKQKRYAEASSQLKQAMELAPRDPGLFRQLGEVYYQAGNYEEAIAQFREALAVKPDFAEASYELGTCYNKLNMVAEEIEAYRKALAIKPDMSPALISLGNAYFGQKDYDAAIEQYNKALKIKPNDSSIHYNIGAAYSNKGNFEQAVAAYSKAVDIDDKMGDAHYGLAYGFYMLKKYDLAWKHINIAVGLGVKVSKEQLEAIRKNIQ